MKEKIFSLSLIVIELLFYYIIGLIFNIPVQYMYKTGFIWFVLLFAYKHYKIQSTLVWDEINSLLKVLFYYCCVLFVLLYPNYHFLLKMIGVGFFMFCICILLDRTIRILFRDILARKTLIIGTGDDAYRIGKIAHNNRFALTNVVGFVRVHKDIKSKDLLNNDKVNVFDYNQLEKILDDHKIDQIIIAIPDATSELLDEVSKKIFGKAKYIKIVPKLNFTMTFNSKINDFDGVLLISTSRGKIGVIGKLLKRCIDICAGIAGCLLLLPLTFYVKQKNKKSGDTDPIFFTQERIGLDGKPIKIYKYRSMVPNAEQVLEELMEKDPAIKEEYLTNKKLINDPRITEVGQFLRKTSLDEFPQFINVLKGEMSLVGPRPYLPREKENMDIYYESIIRCKPGITGMWQANGRSDVGFIDRCKFDDYYYKNWSLGLDIIIIYKTIKSVLYGKGAL